MSNQTTTIENLFAAPTGWPEQAVEILKAAQVDMPHGCGACAHAEWIIIYENKKLQARVGVCRQGIRMYSDQMSYQGDSQGSSVTVAGYAPLGYCTAQNAGLEG